MSENGPRPLRSARWFAARDLAGFIHRASLHSEGISRESLAGRPVVGICNSWSGARQLQPALPRARRGGQARRPAGRRAAARVPDDLARREPDEADGDALSEPHVDGRRGVDPVVPARCDRADRRLRQDGSRPADGRRERRRARDRAHRRPVRARVLPRARARRRHRPLALRRHAARRAHERAGVRRAGGGGGTDHRTLQRARHGLDDGGARGGARHVAAGIRHDPRGARRPLPGRRGDGASRGRDRRGRAAPVADPDRGRVRQRDQRC